jgi:hypothetical protein
VTNLFGWMPFDTTSDALNNTVTLVTNLLVALLPLFIIVGVFGIVIGLFMGKKGIFGKLERY